MCWYIKTYVFDCWRSKVLSNRTNVLLVTKTIIQAVLQSACVSVTWNSKHHVVMPHDSLVIVWQSQIIFKVFVLQSHDIPDIICYRHMILLTLYVTVIWYSWHYMLQSHDTPDIICYSHMIFLTLYVTVTRNRCFHFSQYLHKLFKHHLQILRKINWLQVQ